MGMVDNFFIVGKAINIKTVGDDSCLSFEGIIKKIEDYNFTVELKQDYEQNKSQKVECIITNETKTKACIFESIIKNVNKNILDFKKPHKDNVKIAQRRQYVRVPIDKEVNCYLIGINDKKIESNKVFPAIVKDIGGGGVLLNSALTVPIGTIFTFEIMLNNNKFLLTIKVLRSMEDEEDGSIDLGCKFIGIDDADRQKIISYCNKQQVVLRRKKKKAV